MSPKKGKTQGFSILRARKGPKKKALIPFLYEFYEPNDDSSGFFSLRAREHPIKESAHIESNMVVYVISTLKILHQGISNIDSISKWRIINNIGMKNSI